MQAGIVNTFITAAAEAFTRQLNVGLQRQNFERKSAVIASLPMAIAIGLTGDLQGNVVFAMCEDMAFSVAKQMLPRSLPATIKKEVNAAIGELANVITGLITIKLSEDHDLVVDITPPLVVTGRYMALDFQTKDPSCLCITFISDIGMLEINISADLHRTKKKAGCED